MKPLPLLVLLSACGPPDTGDTSDTGEIVPATDFGFVYVASEPGLGFSDAGAVFRRGLRFAYDCESQTVEGCAVLTCGDTAHPYDPVGVGTVEITGASAPIALAFDAGYEGLFLPGEELFTGGESLSASAPGGDGPAIALSVVAPQAVTVTAPAWPSGADTLAVHRAGGLSFTWTGASAGSVVANLSDTSQAVSVKCAFPAEDGAGAMPAAALGALPAGGGYLDLEVRSEALMRIDTWEVGLAASTHARVGAQSLAIAQVELE